MSAAAAENLSFSSLAFWTTFLYNLEDAMSVAVSPGHLKIPQPPDAHAAELFSPVSGVKERDEVPP